MKNVTILVLLILAAGCGSAQAQKVKVFQAKVLHYDRSATKGILYDVGSDGLVMVEKKTVSAMSRRDIQETFSKDQLPTFVVPFEEVRQVNIRRRKSSGRGFGLGYLATFVTLETAMVVGTLSDKSNRGCDGMQQKPSFGDAVIGASCAAPPGILVFGVVSLVGGGVGSVVGLFPRKQVTLDAQQPETDAREKLGKYALNHTYNRACQTP